jgi:hypothetical protein
MAQMIRKQLYIDPENDQFLKRRSKELGVSEAELVRQVLHAADSELQAPPRVEAAEEAARYMEECARIAEAQARRGWTRDDLYEERLGRYASRHEHSGLRS